MWLFEDEDAIHKAGAIPPRRIATWSHTHVEALISQTPMLATILARLAQGFAKRWPIKILSFPFAQTPLGVFAYWHLNRDQDTVLQAFVDAEKVVPSAVTRGGKPNLQTFQNPELRLMHRTQTIDVR